MKNSRLLGLLLWSLLPPVATGAQEVAVHVTCAGEPLPYAYVFRNTALHGVTDTLGMFRFSASEIKAGDTLSFYHIGARELRLIYDGTAACAVALEPTEIDAVVVTARRKVKLGEDIRAIQNVNWYEEFRGDVQMRLTEDSIPPADFSGRFLRVYIPPPKPNTPGRHILEFTPEDGNDVSKNHFVNALGQAVTLIHLRPQSPMNENIRIAYDGKTADSLNIYSVIRKYNRGTANYQLRLFVDPETKVVRQLTLYMIDARNRVLQMNATYTYAGERNRLFPATINAVMTDNTTGRELFACQVANTTLSLPIKEYAERARKELKQQRREK